MTNIDDEISKLIPIAQLPEYCSICGVICRESWDGTPPKYDHFTSPYGMTWEGEKVCYMCCAVRDARHMQETGAATLYLYLTSDPVHPERFNTTADGRQVRQCNWFVSNWPGSLKFRCGAVQVGRHNIARKRYDVWFEAFGDQWHGVTYGDNTQICHVKRIKSPKMYDVTATAYELWGNAKDGFDTNNFYKRFHVRLPESSLNRTLLMLVKDHFQGFSFAWSENCSRPMVRAGITLDTNSPYMNEEITDIFYRGHVIGQLEIKPVR